jgi:hypothetical protein
MRVGAIPESLIERIVMRLGVVPRPLVDTQMAFTLGRIVMAGADLGVFELLAGGPATSAEVAEGLGTDPHATDKLLFALATSDYVRFRDGRYELTETARKWLLRESPTDLTDKLRFGLIEWEWVAHTEEYVRTGRPLDVHHISDPEVWDSYQRGMRAMAAAFSAARRVARALRPGGHFAILDAFRPRHPGDSGQLPSLLEFYFALTSQSGTWTPEEMADWQRAAGLAPKRPIRLRSVPGAGIQAAVKALPA